MTTVTLEQCLHAWADITAGMCRTKTLYDDEGKAWDSTPKYICRLRVESIEGFEDVHELLKTWYWYGSGLSSMSDMLDICKFKERLDQSLKDDPLMLNFEPEQYRDRKSNPWVSMNVVVELLAVCRTTVYTLIESNKWPTKHEGKYLYIDAHCVRDEMLKRGLKPKKQRKITKNERAFNALTFSIKRRCELNGWELVGEFQYSEWVEICARYDNRCLACGTTDDITIDHIVPLSLGGPNTIDNVQPLCRRCNGVKQQKRTNYRAAIDALQKEKTKIA
jgi:hypothetical protein